MLDWNSFIYFAIPALLLWALGAWLAWKGRSKGAMISTTLGVIVFGAFITALWISLERPPLRTMGETRLWYSFFMPVAGMIVYSRWRFKWILSFSFVMALVFIAVNLAKPEIHSKAMMPALQSAWFAPHVIVYMFAYAIMGAAALMSVWLLWIKKSAITTAEMQMTDNLVDIGVAFITIGMLFGALWAKEAWGHYWAWDPKETWAAATWLCYLAYIHLRLARPKQERPALAIIIFAFVLLQMCWWGINYLPSAQATSVHTYSM